MDEIDITSARCMTHPQTIENDAIKATIDGMGYTVLAAGNTEYDEIMRQVASGDLTIADAD